MSADIIQFIPKPNPNRHILDRMVGVPANVAAAEYAGEEGYQLTELANKIFAEALDVGAPDLWKNSYCPNGIHDLDWDGKEPA